MQQYSVICSHAAPCAMATPSLHRGCTRCTVDAAIHPQCHVLHEVLHGSHEPSCSRSIDTLVRLEHRLLTDGDARVSDEREVRPHTDYSLIGKCGLIQITVSSFVQRSGAARTGFQPRCRWCVDRRLSCGTDIRHDVSTGCSILGRSVRRLQQHVGAPALQWFLGFIVLRVVTFG
jgi:hypothetical protein